MRKANAATMGLVTQRLEHVLVMRTSKERIVCARNVLATAMARGHVIVCQEHASVRKELLEMLATRCLVPTTARTMESATPATVIASAGKDGRLLIAVFPCAQEKTTRRLASIMESVI